MMTVWSRSDFVFADGVRILPYFPVGWDGKSQRLGPGCRPALRTLSLLRNEYSIGIWRRGGGTYGNAPACPTARVGTPSARRPGPPRWGTEAPGRGTLGYGPQEPLSMAPPRAHGPPGGPDRSPPGAAMPPPSAVSRCGAAPGGAGPAPSPLGCGAAPRPGRPGGAGAPHHPTPPAPLPA